MKLDIILRTHSGDTIHAGKRFVPDLKREIIVKCLKSLINSLNNSQITSSLTVIDDHSDQDTKERIKKELEKITGKTEFIELRATGNSESLAACFDHAKASSADVLYFVEDDYVHFPHAIQEMIETYQEFKKNLGGKEVGIFPVDYPDRYTPSGIYQSILVLGKNRHWRTVKHSTFTFLISHKTLVDHWSLFDSISKIRSDFVSEDMTINKLWEQVTLFSPIPTLAIHMQGKEQLPPYVNWQELWDSLY